MQFSITLIHQLNRKTDGKIDAKIYEENARDLLQLDLFSIYLNFKDCYHSHKRNKEETKSGKNDIHLFSLYSSASLIFFAWQPFY